MALKLAPETQAAVDLAKRAVPDGGELDADLLLAALLYATSLRERLPLDLRTCLDQPTVLHDAVPERVSVAPSLQPIFNGFLSAKGAITPSQLFLKLIEGDVGREVLLSKGLKEQALEQAISTLQRSIDDTGSDDDTSRLSGWRHSPERKKAIEALGSFGRMLTASEPPYRGVSGFEEPIRDLVRTLSRMRSRSAIVIGYSGTGKSALIYELARLLYHCDPSLPAHLRELDIFELSPNFLRSGASMVGQYDERVSSLIRVLQEYPRIILFVDEIHSLFRSGMHDRDPFTDANEAFKGKLASGEITCIGCTTIAEYRHAIEPDPALARRFSVIRLEPPTSDATVLILKARRPRMEEYFSPPPFTIPDHIIERVVELTDEYLPSQFQPAKAIQLLDEACAFCVTSEPRVNEVTEEALWEALEDVIGHSVLRGKAVTEVNLVERLKQKIIGQDETIEAIARAFVAGVGQWMKRDGPRGVYFFCGPTGVGKTETALLLSGILSGGTDALVRVNCNALQGSGHDSTPAINILLGPPPGFVGYVRGEGGLLSSVRDKPECVVLFDEIEKADPGVAKLVLQILDEGRVEDNDGNLLDFRRTFIVFTTNAGCTYENHKIGILQADERDDDPIGADVDAVKDELRSIGYGEEFFGRIDHFFVFRSLHKEEIRRILEIQITRLKNGADVRGYRLTWDDAVVDYLVNEWQPRFGVRHLTTILRNRIIEQLSVAEAQGELKGVKTIQLCVLQLDEPARESAIAGVATRERQGESLILNLA